MRYKCKIAYDGSGFSGYQVQPNKRTVQLELENALAKIHKGATVKVFASGRTDAGVHAKGQVIHFDSDLVLPPERWIKALNALLPADVAVLDVEVKEGDFHARFAASGKEYRYFVSAAAVRDPFSRQYAYHFPYSLDIERMREAAKLLTGTHDFTSFCSSRTEVVDRIRTLEQIEIVQDRELVTFRFRGNGFLYNMVRILVGTLLQVGNGVVKVEEVSHMLAAKDRTKAGKTAPPEGLYLWEVYYEGTGNKKNSYDN